MLSIHVQTDVTLSWLSDVAERQLPFATSKALNATVKDVQAAERAHLRVIFTLRREQWADRAMKITHFATKTAPWAAIAVQPPGSTDRSDILAKFEDETEKIPHAGGHSIVIPVDAKRTGAGVVSNTMRPRTLNFRPSPHASTGYTVLIGDQNTVLIQRPDGRGVIIQKNGPHVKGARDGTLLYLLRPKVAIKPDLHFESIGERIVDERWAEQFREAWALALETAR
jgi:hypothetical protein